MHLLGPIMVFQALKVTVLAGYAFIYQIIIIDILEDYLKYNQKKRMKLLDRVLQRVTVSEDTAVCLYWQGRIVFCPPIVQVQEYCRNKVRIPKVYFTLPYTCKFD